MQKFINFIVFLSLICFAIILFTPLPSPFNNIDLWLIAVILLFWSQKRPDRAGFERYLFITSSLYVIIKYWIWRTTETLSYFSFLDFIAALILLLAEIYSLVMLISSIFVCISPIKRSRFLTINNTDDSSLPSIDVFIPTYNEPLEIIKPTILASLNLIYPKNKIKVYVLDDGSTEQKRLDPDPQTRLAALKRFQELKSFCEEVGAIYLTRQNNKNAKAGNLNEALKRSNGDFIAVFDCDHIPAKDFLLYTLPYHLENDKLFVVQTPHFFINPDPIEKNLRTFYAAPSENEMFYRKIQPGLDFWNSSFFCGSAALLRRKSLMEVGGFLGKSVTEDAETSINLHAKGHDSAYVDRPLICGLTPETFTSFIRQRIRWAQGMIQIFIFHNPFFKKGLKWYQRICYNNCIFFWFYGFARIIFIIAPLFFIFFNLHIYNASLKQILTKTLPYILTIYSIDYFLFGKVRWPFFSELYETITSIYILPAIIKTIIKPERPQFKVTPKKETLTKDILSPLSKPFYFLFFSLIFGLIYGIWRFNHEMIYRDTLLVTLSWTIFNLIIIFWILGALYERRQLRRFHRAKAWGKIDIYTENQKIMAELNDLSLSGIGFKIKKQNLNLKQGDILLIKSIDRFGEQYKFKIKITRIKKINIESYLIGAEFIITTNEELQKLTVFVYGDSERWEKFLQEKEKPLSFLQTIIFMIRYTTLWSLKSLILFIKETKHGLKRLVNVRTFSLQY